MNNSDFQKLLTTNDKALISELTKPRKRTGGGPGKAGGKGAADGEKPKGRQKGEGKGRKGGKDAPAAGQAQGAAKEDAYTDRAKQRREMAGEYEKVAAEWENHGEVTIDQSKYLGGDVDHTHLVKGLDYALLTKVRTELTKQQKADELQQARAQRKAQKKQHFQTVLARKVWHTVVETLHPHHGTFAQRTEKMGKAISMGQRIRGAPSVFLPGRMAYEFDTEIQTASSDVPRIIYLSKEDAPAADWSKKVASILPESVARVRDAFQRAIEERRQRKRDKTMGAEASYTVAQKVTTKQKARDLENDIFQGAGGFDTTQVVRSATPSSEAKAPAKQQSSYFDDMGAEKYRQAPKGQIDPSELEVEEGAEDVDETAPGAFDAAERFSGARPGWVFKLGPQGLGYYRDRRQAAAAPAPAAGSSAGERKPLRVAKHAAPSAAPDEGDAYGECLPDAGLGYAGMGTGLGDSDDEGAKDDKSKKAALMNKKKSGDKEQDSVAANQKASGEAKKRKMSELQEWNKIDTMIKKGKVPDLGELEAHASRQRRHSGPAPREIFSTPAYF